MNLVSGEGFVLLIPEAFNSFTFKKKDCSGDSKLNLSIGLKSLLNYKKKDDYKSKSKRKNTSFLKHVLVYSL